MSHVLDQGAIEKLQQEIDRNVVALWTLGEDHLEFASGLHARFWRQRVSRLYYSALNMKRGVTLNHSGDFSTDVSDHKNIGNLPPDFPSASTFGTKLMNLRDDRNLADYSHLASESDLVLTPTDAQALVVDFQTATRNYLKSRGVTL